jgi:hypothetical protein
MEHHTTSTMKTITITIPVDQAMELRSLISSGTMSRFERWYAHHKGEVKGGSMEGAWILYQQATELRELISDQLLEEVQA